MAGNQYNSILTTRLDLVWDRDQINELGKEINDLSGKVDLTKFDPNQQAELASIRDQMTGMFVQNQQSGLYEFSSSIKQLGSYAIPYVARQMQSYGRALADMTQASKTYSTQIAADAKMATAYRTMANARSMMNGLTSTGFTSRNAEEMFGDALIYTARRFDKLSRNANEAELRSVWSNRLTTDAMLRKEIGTLSQNRGLPLTEDDITDLISRAVYGLGTRSKIREDRLSQARFAPKFEHKDQQYDPNDIFGNKSLRAAYMRNGLRSADYSRNIKEKELAYSGSVYSDIIKLQKSGNQLAQRLAIETGLATFVEPDEQQVKSRRKNHGLLLRWNAEPTRDQLNKFLGLALQEGRQIRSGQAQFEKDPDKNYNISKAFQDVIGITDIFARRANGVNGDEFAKRYIDAAGADIDLSGITPEFKGKTSRIQNTVGRIATYAMPYTTVEADPQTQGLRFIPRTKEEMQKIVRYTGQLKTSSDDKGILVQNSQLTHLAGLDPRKDNRSFGGGQDGNGHILPSTPVLVYMPVDDMWEKDDKGYLLRDKDRKLTAAGKIKAEAIENGASYNGEQYKFVYTNGESAGFLRLDKYNDAVKRAKEKGLDNPFYGFDPTTDGWLVRNADDTDYDTAKTNKRIISAKRIATQGTALKDYLPEDQKQKLENMQYAAVSIAAQRELAKLLDPNYTPSEEHIVDGAGLIDPRIAPFSFQARGLGEDLKGVLANQDWRSFLRSTVKKTKTAASNPFIKFDRHGQLKNYYMASVALEHLSAAEREGIFNAINDNTEYNGMKRKALLDKYFYDVMDEKYGALIESNQLKGPQQMTAKALEDYDTFLEQQVGIKTKTARKNILENKRQQGQIFTLDGKDYVRLDAKETAANIKGSLDFTNGLYMSKSDEDFHTNKNTIGRQIAEAIGFTSEQKELSARLYAEKLARMEDDDYWINTEQFSQRADIQNRFFQAENKAAFLRDDKDAREYIASQKEALRKRSMTHYMLPYETDTTLAAPFLGSYFEDMIRASGAKINEESGLEWLYPSVLKDRSYLQNRFKLSDEDLDKISTNGEIDLQKIMFSENGKQLWSILGRTPSALNTFSRMLNLSFAGANQNKLIGGSGVTMMSSDAIYRMNTGDFDGDTVWADHSVTEGMLQSLENFNQIAAMDPETKAEIDKLMKEQTEALNSKKLSKTPGGRVADEIYNFLSGQSEMGKASAVMRNALDLYDISHTVDSNGNLVYNNPEDVQKFIKAYNFGSAAYDKATSEGQNMGWAADYFAGFGKASYLAGRQFSRFQKDVGENWTKPDSEKAKSQYASIFNNRLISLNNMGSLAESISAGKIRQGFGFDFGFGDMVNSWLEDAYGSGSKGYNQTLFEVASDYASILKGQYDLSHLLSDAELSQRLSVGVSKLKAEIDSGKLTGYELTRVQEEYENLKKIKDKYDRDSSLGGQADLILTRDNLQRRIDSSTNSETKAFFQRALNIAGSITDTDQVGIDQEHQDFINSQLEKIKEQKAFDDKLSTTSATGLVGLLQDRLGKKIPSTTAMENYIRSAQTLPVTLSKIVDQNPDNDIISGIKEINPSLWSKRYQKLGLENEILKIFGGQKISDTDTLFGSFVHDVLKTNILEAERARGSASNPTYNAGSFLASAKDLWDKGTFKVNGRNVSYKDIFTGAVPDEQLSDAMSLADWQAISDWLGNSDVNAELPKLGSVSSTVRNKILSTFSKTNNNAETFLRRLYGNGRVFEAENEIYDAVNDRFFNPYSEISRKNMLIGKPGEEISYRPDLIWEYEDKQGKSWLDMYDWKPNEEGGQKSIYQMISYARYAEERARQAWDRRGTADATAEDERWLRYLDSKGNFRMRNLHGKDYTGRGYDTTFDYNLSANKPLIDFVMGDYKTARELYQADRNNPDKLLDGFDYLIKSGIIKEDETADDAFNKWLGYRKTFGELQQSAEAWRSKNFSDGMTGKDYVESHGQEWNYLVAKQAQNQQKLNEAMETLRGKEGQYRSRVRGNEEYSQFDFLYNDIEKLNDPDLLAALTGVYQDVLPYAIGDIGNYKGDREKLQADLMKLVDVAAIQDPIMTENLFRRQLYGSKGSDVFDNVRKVVNKANLAAGTRQTFKAPFKDFFETQGAANDIWRIAAEIQNEYDKYNGKFDTDEAIAARDKYQEFTEKLKEMKFFKANPDKVTGFMSNAGKYEKAQEYIDKLRETQSQLVAKLYEDDIKQTEMQVAALIGERKTPEQQADMLIETREKALHNYIASSQMDIIQSETDAGKLIDTLSAKRAYNKDELNAIVSSGDFTKIDEKISGADKDNKVILEEIKMLMQKRKTLQEAISKVADYLDNDFKEFSDGLKESTKYNAETRRLQSDAQFNSFIRQGNKLDRSRYMPANGIVNRIISTKESLTQQYEQRQIGARQQIAALTEEQKKYEQGSDGYNHIAEQLSVLAKEENHAAEEAAFLQSRFGAASVVASDFRDSISRLATRLGRQLFQKAIQEVKQFVTQFDKSMTEIQMVTLKTNDEINTIGDNLIQTAIKYNASISEITATTTALYRQGLSDEDVEERLGVLTKFSKVSNVSSTDASKLLTVIMNSDMADSAQQALDIVSAISDSAPTDAAQISKALQRSLYAASTSGVNLEQLIAMAAAITSKTQLGGATAGTTLSNVFNRMGKVGSNEVVYDENGNAVGKTQLRNALGQAGVNLYEKDGTIDIFKTLSELGKWWGQNDNATIKSMITNAVAGTGRQSNNFQALMDSFSEVDESGKTLIETFMEIANSADGIVNTKFDAYTESLAAKMAEFKSSFDKLVSTIIDTGAISAVVGAFADVLQGLAYINEATGNVIPIILGLGGAVLALTNPIVAAAAGITGLVSVIGLLGKAAENSTEEMRIQQRQDDIQAGESALAQIQKISDKQANGEDLSNEDYNILSSAIGTLEKLGFVSSDVTIGISDMGENASYVATVLEAAAKQIIAAKDSLVTNDFKKFLDNFNDNYTEQASQAGISGLTEEDIRDAMTFEKNLHANEDYEWFSKEYRKDLKNYKRIYEVLKNSDYFKNSGLSNELSSDPEYAAQTGQLSRVIAGDKTGGEFDWSDDVSNWPILEGIREFLGKGKRVAPETVLRDKLAGTIAELSGVDWNAIVGEENSNNKQAKAIASQTMADVALARYRSSGSDLTADEWISQYLYNEDGSMKIDTISKLGVVFRGAIRRKVGRIIGSGKKEEAQSQFDTLMAQYASAYEANQQADKTTAYKKFALVMNNPTLSTDEKIRQLSRDVLPKLSGDARIEEFVASLRKNPSLAEAPNVVPGIVDYANNQVSKYELYKSRAAVADTRRTNLESLLAGRRTATTLNPTSLTNSKELADDLASIVGEDIVSGRKINELSADFAYRQIDADAKGITARLTNAELAAAGQTILDELSNGKSLEEVFENYSDNMRSYLESSIEGLTEYENALGTEGASKAKAELQAEIDRLKASLENLTDQAIQWIAGLTSVSASTRESTYSQVYSQNAQLNKLRYYLGNMDGVSYEDFVNNADMQQSFMNALGITDTSEMLQIYRNAKKSDEAMKKLRLRLNSVAYERSNDLSDTAEQTGIKLPQTYNPYQEAADNYQTSDTKRQTYSDLVDNIIGKSVDDAVDYITNQTDSNTMLGLTDNPEIGKLISRGIAGESLSGAEKNSLVRSIYENAGRISEYYNSIEAQLNEVDEAFDAVLTGTYDSSKFAVGIDSRVTSRTNNLLNTYNKILDEYEEKNGTTDGFEDTLIFQDWNQDWNEWLDQLMWLRNYRKSQISGDKSYSNRLEAEQGMKIYSRLLQGDYTNAKGAWEKLLPEQQEVINSLSGGILSEILQSIEERYDENDKLTAVGFQSPEIEQEMRAKLESVYASLLAYLFTGLNDETLTSWASGIDAYNFSDTGLKDISNFWKTYSSFMTSTDSMRSVQRAWEEYEKGNRGDSIIDVLTSALGFTKDTLLTKPETVKEKYQQYISDFQNLLDEFFKSQFPDLDFGQEMSSADLAEYAAEKGNDALRILIDDACLQIKDGHVDVSESIGNITASLNQLISQTAEQIRNSSSALNYGRMYDVLANMHFTHKELQENSTLGRYGEGNIDLFSRPVVRNPDGTISTVESFSTNIDGKEVLLPSIVNGQRVSEEEAIQHYLQTGEYLGKFNTVEEANNYARRLHEEQDAYYNGYSPYFNSSIFHDRLMSQYQNDPAAISELNHFLTNDQEYQTMAYLGDQGYLSYDDMLSYMSKRKYGSFGNSPYDYNPIWSYLSGTSGGLRDMNSWDAGKMYQNMQSLINTAPAEYDTMMKMIGDTDGLDDFIGKVQELVESEADVETATKALTPYLETMKQYLGEKLMNAATKGKSGLSAYKNELTAFARGGADTQKAMASMVDKTQQLNDQLYSLRQYEKGSAKKQDYSDLSSLLGIDADVLKKATGAQKEMFIKAGKAIIEPETVELSSAWDEMINSALDQLYDEAEQLGMDPVIIEKAIELVGNGDSSGFADVVAGLSDDAVALVAQLFEFLASLGGTFTTVAEQTGKNSGRLRVKTNFTGGSGSFGSSRSGRGSSGGGGGGGGGNEKSPAQNALTAAQHFAGQAQHMINMSEADMYHPDKVNDFEGYVNAVLANIFTLEQAGDVWRDQISILQGQMASVEEGTDDWWALKEAIDGYEESLAKLEESIDNVRMKMFEEAKEQYTYAITDRQHTINMLTTDRTFFSRTNDYNKEIETIDALNGSYKRLDESYREAIAMYKALANDEYKRNGESDYWWSIQQEINSTTEALAELKNTMSQLNAEKLNIVIEYQEAVDKPENNAFSLMDIYKSRYLEREDYEAFEKVMDERKTLLKSAISTNIAQVRELESLLSSYEIGSDEWLATRDQIWTVKLDSATKENELIELEVELAEQRLAQITQAYDRQTAYENHANTIYETYANAYKSVSNYSGYRSTLREEIGMFKELKKAAEASRDAALEQMAALQQNTPEWYAARDAVYQYEEAVASAYASEIEKTFALEESMASELIEVYNDRMSVYEQSSKLLQNQRKMYDNNNDYGGYIQTLREENKLLETQTESRRQYLAELQNRLSNTTIGTNTWKNLRKEIMNVEQAISSAEVTLDNFATELEKTKIDYYLDKMDRAQSDRTHAITMIQYEETKYQNSGELSNYAIMLQKENDARQENINTLERDIELLKEEMENTEAGSKQYQRLIDAIKKKEEAIASDSNAMEKNIKLIEETYNKINQLRKSVEDQVDAEIKKRKQQQKNELAAEVNLQNQMLNVIKKRYTDEWSLITKDIQKRKDALNEEKALINERLQARKDAMDTEDKYEELRNLEQQLALISNDPTRTKDQKELTKKINDLRKDITWDRAAEEAKTATEIIDDEIESMNDWIEINEENLNEMLSDANNFAEEVNYILSGSYDDLVTWMQENNVEFQNSLDETQQQMIEGWETTWKIMHGIVDTYWDQINEVLSSKDNFIKFMQESVDYITASEAGKATMMYAWSTGYDNMTGATTVSSEAENYEAHTHEQDAVAEAADEIAKAVSAALEWTYNTDWMDQGLAADSDLNVTVVPQVNDYNDVWDLPAKVISDLVPTIEDFEDKYANVGVQRDEITPSMYAYIEALKYEPVATTDFTKYMITGGTYTGSGSSGGSGSGGGGSSKSGSSQSFTSFRDGGSGVDKVYTYQKMDDTYGNANNQNSGAASKIKTAEDKKKTTAYRYASGGIIDYTGPAWVDGSPLEPESVFDAEETKMLRSMVDALNYISLTPSFVPSADMLEGNTQNIGDINIVINNPQLKSDADIEAVAKQLGRAFTKQMAKEGLNLSRYAM